MSQYGGTALLLACEYGHFEVVKWLVTDAGSDAVSEQNSVSCALCCQLLASDDVVFSRPIVWC